MEPISSATALWGAVVVSGLYHGVNPGMGWPLAVSAALMERKPRALPRALGMLALGHLIAMVAILLPFSAMLILVEYQREIQIGAALLVIALGIYLLINRRHPRFLARVHPRKLVLWSFLAAMAHGAGLMLVPIYLGICKTVETDTGHAAADQLMQGNATIALAVAVAHTLAMTAAGGALAFGVYRWLGLEFLRRSWFNLDVVWALSLILVGSVALWTVH
ncbi:hypothetical protein PGB28_16845 [Primorskyibacter aestuariivivens]|uniref:hypothetical protein n=1 Tax=Primorskyibacter aestuariivivens TaxID=1888912 RepID=UPI002301F061|nr:hypothetical protein [Primorskyibacter aestuariivivens]MDA7430132.1 hypothetical protein [Primorskyibacter aestuariivivens]